MEAAEIVVCFPHCLGFTPLIVQKCNSPGHISLPLVVQLPDMVFLFPLSQGSHSVTRGERTASLSQGCPKGLLLFTEVADRAFGVLIQALGAGALHEITFSIISILCTLLCNHHPPPTLQ